MTKISKTEANEIIGRAAWMWARNAGVTLDLTVVYGILTDAKYSQGTYLAAAATIANAKSALRYALSI